MVKENLLGKMEDNILAAINMTKSMEREHLFGTMEQNMMGYGLMENNMELAIIQIVREKKERDYGKGDRE